MIGLNLLSGSVLHAMQQLQSQQMKTIELNVKLRPLTSYKPKVKLPKYLQLKNICETPQIVKSKKKKQKRNIKEIVIKNQTMPTEQDLVLEQSPKNHPHYNLVGDGTEELVLRQKAIEKSTKKKNVNEEINDLKKLEEQLLLTYQGVQRDCLDEENKVESILRERRQQIYKKIYENVKIISGVHKQEEMQKQRDEDILNYISRQQDQYKNQPIIQKQLLEAKQQIQELNELSLSRKASSHRMSSDSIREHRTVQITDLFIKRPIRQGSQKKSFTLIPSRKITREISIQQPQIVKRSTTSSPQKQIDQELLHILLTRWKDINQKQVRKPRSQMVSQIDEQKRKKFKILAHKLLAWLQRMNRCKISLKMLDQHKFPEQPYSIDGSFVFLRSIKFQDFIQIKQLLQRNRYLLFEFNHLGQTCLHIAAKQGNIKILKFLIEYGADYESKDFMNRTPLFYTVQCENKEFFKYLLQIGATPWNISSSNQWFSNILKSVRKIHTIISISPLSLRPYLLEHELNKLL